MLLADLPPTGCFLASLLTHVVQCSSAFLHIGNMSRDARFSKFVLTICSFFEITIFLPKAPPLLAVSLLVGRPRLVGREEEGKASKFSPAGRRVAQPSPSPVEPAGWGGKGAPRPMKPNVEWTNATSSRSASAPRYLALSLSLSSKGQR